MKKIMFNDKYGLTQAVLEGRKTQTRRIVHESALIDWEIHDKYHNLPDAVGHRMDFEYFMSKYARYEVGEKVAVAQSYSQMKVSETISVQKKLNRSFLLDKFEQSKGWGNKMFVEAKYMPHRIRITNVRIERLQDISDEDCLKEGFKLVEVNNGWGNEASHHEYLLTYNDNLGRYKQLGSRDHKEAYSLLIDNISGAGTWEKNPYVFVYDFELVK